MPVNNTLGTNGSSPVELFKVNQSNSQSPRANPSRAESSQRLNQNEEVFTVEISQEALRLQDQERDQQAEFDQELQANREVRAQTDQDIQNQRAQARETSEQQSIDIVV